MKILFLDHDGVICLASEWGSRYKKQRKAKRKLSQSVLSLPVDARFDIFNKSAVKVLNEILIQSGAEIVVSSDWQYWASVEEMGDYYESQGIIKRPIDFTGNAIDQSKVTWHREWDKEGTRSLEIQDWLSKHPEVTHWVAVDDLDLGKRGLYLNTEFYHDWGLENFALVEILSKGIKQKGLKEKILSFLH